MAGVLPTERLQPRAVLGLLRLPHNSVLSVSPERFLWLEQQRIQTRPIKGTLPRLADAEQDAAQARRLADSPRIALKI